MPRWKKPKNGTNVSMDSFANASGSTRHYIEHVASTGSPSLKRTTHAYSTSQTPAVDQVNHRAKQEDRPSKPGTKDSKTKSQTMSALLEQHQNQLHRIAELKMAWEGHPLLDTTCDCGDIRSVICRDCTGMNPLCAQCFLGAHKYTPFHFAHQYNGRFLTKVPQSQLGRIFYLGHNNDPCPAEGSNAHPLMLDVVDVNGIHACTVHYCKCEGSEFKWEQLLRIGLFPGTIIKPATAFTFQLLYLYDHQSSIAKTSALDFITCIRRSTNNAFPDDVPNCYDTFRRVMRIWRAVQISSRSGELHGMNELMRTATGGDPDFHLALKCPACPQPGLNISEGVLHATSNHDKHKITVFLSLDGNFKQQLKMKNNDPEDIELFTAFFGDRTKFETYLKNTNSDVEAYQKSTCANLRANNLQSQLKFLSMQVSGVISCKCARHDMFRPGATVDLKRGESFAYTDFALRNALQGYEHYPFIDISYDIACQYSKKIGSRFEKHFPQMSDCVRRAAFHIPKLHCHGHSDDCKYQFSFDFANNVGRTHGERIESGWAEGNLAGPSTREMNPGHRHEVLSCFYNEWNYQQTIRLASFLSKKLIESRRQTALKETQFSELSLSLGAERIERWSVLDTAPVVDNGEVLSVYRVKDFKAPTIKDIQDRLRTNTSSFKPGNAHLTPSDFIAEGIRLESRQRDLRNKVKCDDASLQRVAAEIVTERIKLRNEIDVWRDDQVIYMPDALSDTKQSQFVENEGLVLPSNVKSQYRTRTWFQNVAGYEMELRKAQADDALCDLRLCLKYRDYLKSARRRVSYGNRHATRTAVILRRASGFVEQAASDYRHARAALIALGMAVKDPAYPELKPDDIYIKVIYANKELGTGTCTGGWIWTNGKREALSVEEESEWEEEGNRVEWFRAKIDLQQWREESEILNEELKRTFNWFGLYSRLWSSLGEQSVGSGYAEYAFQKADIFSRRANDTMIKHAQALAADVCKVGST